MVDLGHGIEGHVELPLHEGGGSLLEGGDAVVGVAAVLGTVDLPLHDGPDVGRRHLVVLANPEVEHPSFGMIGNRLPLGSLDQLKLVDLGALAERCPADALGEAVLEPRVGGAGGGGRGGHRVWVSGAGMRDTGALAG